MMPTYLCRPEGLAVLARYVTPKTLFAFDLDGTLAPIVNDFTATQVAEPVRSLLDRLSRLAKVTVITGRSRKDALAILGLELPLVVGNHGAEWPDDTSKGHHDFLQSCLAWRDQLATRLAHVNGVDIEFKGASLSLHYRHAADRENALAHIDAAIEELEPRPGRIGGKCVVNLVPMEAFTKGEALVAAMEQFGSEQAIYIGDDETDEEVFRLRCVDVMGVHVGKNDRTAAAYYLNEQAELLNTLRTMVDILEHRDNS